MINVVFWKLLVLNYNNTHYIWHVSLKVKVLKNVTISCVCQGRRNSLY